jgi:hypothetical protein
MKEYTVFGEHLVTQIHGALLAPEESINFDLTFADNFFFIQ